MKLIKIVDNKIILKFQFDADVVSAVRSIDGRKWNAALKRWEVPLENLEEVFLKLLPLGFSASHEVMALKYKAEVLQREIDQIRNNLIPIDSTLPLFDFQKTGASFMKAMPFCLLADVPGLGKSIQTIASLEKTNDKVLIVCPATLKYSWKTEIKKWLPEAEVRVVNGDKGTRVYNYENLPQWTIVNYELLLHDFDILKELNFDTIVCDEATRISNPEAQTTKNLKKLHTKKRIALTGTPISNKPDDIWSIFDWLVPGYLGGWFQFRTKYCDLRSEFGYTSGKEYVKIVGYKNLDELSKKVGKFMLRRTKEEVFNDFPKKIIENLKFELTKEERELYQAVKLQVREEIHRLSELDTRSLAILPVKMLRLKQCTNHPKLLESDISSTKLAVLKEMLEPIIASGEKAIIFTQFSEMLHILASELKEYKPFCIYGAVDSPMRMQLVKEFNDYKGGQVIIMTEAGAYGLNMQSASYVFHYDMPWSIAKLQQREDRAHRIGQTKAVTVYNLVAKDTIDEYVAMILQEKNKVSVNILQDAERMTEAGLSQEDIDNILRL